MRNLLKKVNDFQTAFNQPVNEEPCNVDTKVFIMRHRLMEEENNEYLDACTANDVLEIADALGDKLYILLGTLLTHGMQHVIEDVFNEIHSSNMSKLGKDGKPIFREDGKVLKAEGYFKPDLHKVLCKHAERVGNLRRAKLKLSVNCPFGLEYIEP